MSIKSTLVSSLSVEYQFPCDAFSTLPRWYLPHLLPPQFLSQVKTIGFEMSLVLLSLHSGITGKGILSLDFLDNRQDMSCSVKVTQKHSFDRGRSKGQMGKKTNNRIQLPQKNKACQERLHGRDGVLHEAWRTTRISTRFCITSFHMEFINYKM